MDRYFINSTLQIQESYEMPNRLMEILQNEEKREVLFNTFLQYEPDLSYDWFTDYYQQEQGDRNALKQDFTPDCICEILNKINGKANTIADICSGTGGLTIKVWNENKNSFFHCEEISKRAIPVLLFNLSIRGITGEIIQGNVLTREIEKVYKLSKKNRFSDIKEIAEPINIKYDSVIMNPPYSLKWSGETDERFLKYGTPPKSRADYCFILHGLNLMKNDGKLLAILPHGILFRSGNEGKIRENIIKDKLVKSVIGLPNNLFLNTGIPTLMLELQKNSDNTLIIDGSREFSKDKPVNKMTEENIDTIINAYKLRRNIDKLAYIAEEKEIAENGYNLNIPRYVDVFEKEKIPDLKTLLNELDEINKEIKTNEIEIFKMLKDMVGTTSEEEKEHNETTKQFEQYIENKYGQLELEI